MQRERVSLSLVLLYNNYSSSLRDILSLPIGDCVYATRRTRTEIPRRDEHQRLLSADVHNIRDLLVSSLPDSQSLSILYTRESVEETNYVILWIISFFFFLIYFISRFIWHSNATGQLSQMFFGELAFRNQCMYLHEPVIFFKIGNVLKNWNILQDKSKFQHNLKKFQKFLDEFFSVLNWTFFFCSVSRDFILFFVDS